VARFQRKPKTDPPGQENSGNLNLTPKHLLQAASTPGLSKEPRGLSWTTPWKGWWHPDQMSYAEQAFHPGFSSPGVESHTRHTVSSAPSLPSLHLSSRHTSLLPGFVHLWGHLRTEVEAAKCHMLLEENCPSANIWSHVRLPVLPDLP
jgi:hypothetical protein